jgi:hypothetical protein
MKLPRQVEQVASSRVAVRAWHAGALCGRRGEPVRLAAEVIRHIRRQRRQLGRQVVRAFWGGWRHGRA